MLTALLFDLDGTLANTDSLRLKIWQDLLASYDYCVDLDFYQQRISGRLNADILADLLPHLSAAKVDEFSPQKDAALTQLGLPVPLV